MTKEIFKTTVVFLSFFFLLIYGSDHAFSVEQNIKKSITQRQDIRDVLNKVNAAQLKLHKHLQDIYDAYVPNIIGEKGVFQRNILCNLISVSNKIDSILGHYRAAASEVFTLENTEFLRKQISFYYFNQEKRLTRGTKTTSVDELLKCFMWFTDSCYHSGFIAKIKFSKEEAIQVITQVDEAIHAAIATIPGGEEILKFKKG